MENIFEIIQERKENSDSDPAFSLGVKINIGKSETICAVTDYHSCDELKSKINLLKNELDDIIKNLEASNKESKTQDALGINDDSTPEEIWEVLSAVSDNSVLIEQFNNLSEPKRRDLADYIFANCSMFTGKGAYFSAHYVQETGMLVA